MEEVEENRSRTSDQSPLLLDTSELYRSPFKLTWRQLFTLGFLKIVLVTLIVVLAAVVFIAVNEQDENAFDLLAISENVSLVREVQCKKNDFQVQVRLAKVAEINGTQPTTVEVKLEVSSAEEPENYTVAESWLLVPLANDELQEEKFFSLPDTFDSVSGLRFHLTTNSSLPLALQFQQLCLPSLVHYQELFAAFVLVGVYVLIIFEIVHRTIAAMIGSFIALALLAQLHARPTFEDIVSWIDYETIGLLFGMMLMVGIFSESGFFEWSAVKLYKYSKGDLWKMTLSLCLFTAVVSAFLDNVTTILLLTPVTIRLCKVVDVQPEPILLAEVFFSNIGGTATPIGDPPNILIVNDNILQGYGVDFVSMTLHVGLGTILVAGACVFLIRFQLRNLLKIEPNLAVRKDIAIWKRTLTKFSNVDNDESEVRRKLEKYIKELEDAAAASVPSAASTRTVFELEEKYKIKDWPLLISCSIVLSLVILLFFLHSFVSIDLSLAWIAIIGAMVMLVVTGVTDVEVVLEKVEFGTLLFFAALFILMETLAQLGLIDYIGNQTASIIDGVPESSRLYVAVLLVMWISAFASAFIDNIPYTATMIPIVIKLGDGKLGLPPTPLVWALSFGACLGGNGTLIGASANVVATGLAEKEGFHISFGYFFKMGFPVMIVSMLVASIYMVLFHVVIEWY